MMINKIFFKFQEWDLCSARKWVAVNVGTVSNGEGMSTGVTIYPQVVICHNLSKHSVPNITSNNNCHGNYHNNNHSNTQQ